MIITPIARLIVGSEGKRGWEKRMEKYIFFFEDDPLCGNAGAEGRGGGRRKKNPPSSGDHRRMEKSSEGGGKESA